MSAFQAEHVGSIPITRSISQQFDTAGVAELADARDLKSRGWKQPYRFDSGPRHQQKSWY